MPTIPQFDPPAGLTDFGPELRAAWDKTINDSFTENILGVQQEAGGTSQFYNPRTTSTDPPVATKVIRWKGFPLIIQAQHPGDKRAAWKDAERLDTVRGFRRQDEYLEWHVTRNTDGRITRVSFTCEGPEYWTTLAAHDPDKLLALYREHVDPRIQKADLFTEGQYNRWNKWNTTHGAMHLSHPANTLGAEINIAAFATVLRQRDGRVLTDAQELIDCSGYGDPRRASDPHIGEEVNSLAREGFSITLQNPVGLYIAEAPNTTGWKTPNNKPASQFWRVTRGTPDAIVGARFEVPAPEGYIVSDIKIAGVPIEFGGQIADFLDVKLTGVACRKGGIQNPPRACPGAGPSAVGLAGAAPGPRLPSRR
jgi:hypothetical protein